MSSRGLVSVRLPESMVQRLQLTARRHGLTANEFARSVVAGLVGLSGEQIREIPEPDPDGANPRLSLYLGDEGLQVLNSSATASGLSPSSTLRRALNAALTRNLIPSVVQPQENKESIAPFVIGIVLAIVFALLTAIFKTSTASAQQKGKP